VSTGKFRVRVFRISQIPTLSCIRNCKQFPPRPFCFSFFVFRFSLSFFVFRFSFFVFRFRFSFSVFRFSFFVFRFRFRFSFFIFRFSFFIFHPVRFLRVSLSTRPYPFCVSGLRCADWIRIRFALRRLDTYPFCVTRNGYTKTQNSQADPRRLFIFKGVMRFLTLWIFTA